MPHESYEVLRQRLREASELVPLDSYKHFKGGVYHVVGYCILKLNDEAGVSYFNIEQPAVPIVTPLSDWLSPVIVHGEEIERYQRIE
jgi:hypothetical protein